MDTVEQISRYKAVYITMFYELRYFFADDKFNWIYDTGLNEIN
jgi:hypothetical protein